MKTLYRWGLPLLIVLVGVAPVRAQERGADRDSVTILELRRVPRNGGEGRVLRRLSPSLRDRWFPGDSARVRMRGRPGAEALFFGDLGRMDLPMRFEMPALRMHLDTLLGDGTRFRINMDSLMGNRTALRFHLDSLMGHRGAFRIEGGPMMRFRMDGPEGRLRRHRMAPPMRFFYRDGAPGNKEEDGWGFRFRNDDGRQMPRVRTEQRVIRLGRDGEVIEGGDGVRVERDADGGLRIYVPPRQDDKERAPAPPRTRRRG